jgi:acyl carrier protein
MNIEEFIEKFAEQFPEENLADLSADTDFHELDSWASLTSLSLVAMIYAEYGVELDTMEVRNADTIEDLFNVVKSRRG